jgi:predicted transcriptional regulator
LQVNRKKIDIVGDILRVAKNGAGSFHIHEQANMSSELLSKYLKIATGSKLISLKNEKYWITAKGQYYLDNYEQMTKNWTALNRTLKELTLEQDLVRQKFFEENLPRKLEEKTIEEEEQSLLISTLPRINNFEYYNELILLGFKVADAKKIVSWIGNISKKDPIVFSGKKAATIKACLACIGVEVFHYKRTITQRKVRLHYNLPGPNIRRNKKLFLRRFVKTNSL